ncbi:sulfatase-like hydrolase/transferase [Alteraurantiacibacter aestuarii]|uniref:Sulfatase-like hydrolase/transferase n=1 Tax=Alteraurantiacibacter aestuarii TaxID=650004 RepID=A0A844ZK23_9SPHN|nr:sulfatase-like hydrolase/transferase [Alteraurantiacibacter aestuarii]MXO88128.1 sulfatase-like hydrolase/transferase [Alteraurantiacibacter aestuarii]
MGLTAVPANAADEDTPRRPNILLIISDDVGLDVTPGMVPGLMEQLIAQYGPEGHDHPDYQAINGHPASTPVLDQLADDGMVFTDAWAQPFCSPTRASLLTGLFAGRTHVQTYADALSQNHDSFVRTLADRGGYSTAVFGKWHMAGLPAEGGDYPGMKPKEAGFQLFRGNMHAALPSFWDYPLHVQDAGTPAGQWRTEEAPVASLPGIAPSTYAAVAKGSDTIDWIRAQEEADPDRPWFTWLAFNLSHATAIQQPSAMMVPNADTLDDVSRAEMEACGGTFGTNEVGNCSGEALMRAMTNSMDTIIGQVLAAVDDIDPNTYVIYIGDNGTPMYGRPNLDFIDNMYITRTGRGKGSAFESGAHVPMVIRGPGIEAGSQNGEFVHVADLFATILSLAGLEVPETVSNSAGDAQIALDSVSLDPILRGGADRVRDPDHDFILTESSNLMTGGTKVIGARNATFKLVCTDSTEDCDFYNLTSDPLEEYPLPEPGSCAASEDWTTADPFWHYCFLLDVVAKRSIL